jgi:hypothetical protein
LRSAEEIIEKLKGSFNAPSTKDEKLKVVILCIIISTTFWFFSALNKPDYVTQINYPIEVSYNESLYVAISELPDNIPLEVAGGGWDLMTRSFGFGMDPLVIRLDDPLKEGYKMASALRQEIASKLEPVLINYILVDSINFDIDVLTKREFNVIFDSTSLQFAPNFVRTSNIQVSPDKLVLVGPKSLIDTIQNPHVIGFGDRVVGDNVDENVPLLGIRNDFIKANLEEVRVTFMVTEFLQMSKDVVIEKINFNKPSLSISPATVTVYYEWNSKVPQEADSLRLSLVVDFKKLIKRDSTITIETRPNATQMINPRITQKKVKVIYE